MMEKIWCRFQLILHVFLVLVVFLVACQRQEESPPATRPPSTSVKGIPSATPPAASRTAPEVAPETGILPAQTLFKDPVKPFLVEEQAEALPRWRSVARQKPILLLLSGLALQPLPETLRKDVDWLLQNGDDSEVVRRSARPVPDQLLSPDLGVAAGMRQGYFSRVVWVVPVEVGMELLPLADFKAGLRQQAAGWGGDVESFVETVNGAYSGVLGGVPVDVVSIDRLPIVKEPLLVHVDTGFFAAIYRNEVKTPLYPLLVGHFKKIESRGYRVLGVTIARANLSADVPLTMRFLGDDLAAFLANPALLAKPTIAMRLRGEMNYLDSFFQPEIIIEKAQALLKLAPGDADSFYRQYLAGRQMKEMEQGLSALEKAVSLDPYYALEYFELVNQKVKQGEREAALKMLDQAIRALPEHALIGLRKAQLQIEMGRGGEALPLLQKLKALPWSKFYYPDIGQEIDALLKKSPA